MSSAIKLQEVRDELARFPQVMMMPGDLRSDPSQSTLTIIIDEESKLDLPKLTGFMAQARQAANAYSSLDANIPEVDSVKITNDPKIPISGFMVDSGGKRSLVLRTDLLLAMTHDMAMALVTHEYKHSHHHASGRLASMNDAQRQLIELEADRAAEFPVALSAAMLGMMTADEFSRQYWVNDADNQHSPFRYRIISLLEDAYGYKVFRDSGKFEEDWHFHPKRQDFLPVLEDGQRLLNWDAEFAPEIQKLVQEDITYLDSLIGKDGQPIDTEVISQFINHVAPRIQKFYDSHELDAESPSNNYLAKHFEKALEVPALREAVMNMHEKMPLAFKAYDEAVKQASQFVTPSAQDAVINTARQHIVDGISEGKYPETKQVQAAVEYVSMPMANAVEMGN